MSKKILVTGGAGFIGSHISEKLVLSGNEVVCVDNLATGRKDNIQKLLNNGLFSFINLDICDESAFNELAKNNFDEIYHMASPASVTYIVEHPVEAADANSMGTKRLLELARQQRAKILFASSSESYGNPLEHPQKETYWGNVNPVGIRSGYDEGKRFGEALCMAYYREYDVDVKIVRIFNTYGPNSSPKDSRIIPRFITQALKGESVTVHGDGMQTRSFCYVSDLRDGIIKMMQSDEAGPINIGSPEEFRIIDVANMIINKINSKSKIKFVSRPKDDPSRRNPDISKARERLNWKPVVSFDQGLDLTIEYFKHIL